MSIIKIKFKDFVNENFYNSNTLYHGIDKKSANDIRVNGVDISKRHLEKHEVTKLYHGSKYLFDMFDDSKISSGDGSELFGKGYYLTDNIEVANFYAELITKKDKIEKYDFSGPLKSEVPIYSEDADDYAKANKKINKFLLNGNILDTYTYILDNDFVNKLREIYTKYSGWGADESKRLFNTKMEFLRNNKAGINRYRGEILYIIQSVILGDKDMMNELVEYIKSLSYDGVKYKPDTSFEGNIDSYNYVIYNKNVLKSL